MDLRLTQIETVFETQPINGYLYRITVKSNTCYIRRTRSDKGMPMWGHGIIAQTYVTSSKSFVQNCTVNGNTDVGTLENAIEIITNIKE